MNIVEGKNLEGPRDFSSLKGANSYIKKNENNFSEIGYTKIDIVITWDDNSVYKFRLDAHHPKNEYYDSNTIESNIFSAIRFYTKPENLTWMNEKMREDSIKFYSELRDNYQITD